MACENPRGMSLVLWDYGLGFWGIWDDPRYRQLVLRSRPQSVQLHGSWHWLVKRGPDVAKQIQGHGLEVILSLAADGESDESRALAPERWPQVSDAAVKCGAVSVIINAEGKTKAREPGWGWTEHDLPQIAQAFKLMRLAAPDMPIGFTSWSRPDWAPWFPWVGFAGPGGADYMLPQYYKPGAGLAGVQSHWRDCQIQWHRAAEAGTIRKDLPLEGYAQAYGETHDTAGAVWIAQQGKLCAFWVVGSAMHPDDRQTLEAACRLYNLGYHGVSGDGGTGISRWQAAAGLHVDDVCGALTLASLGVP